jgi:hypothetical protein
MSPELRKKYDAMEEERMKRKEKVFEHIKYNMNSDRPSTPHLRLQPRSSFLPLFFALFPLGCEVKGVDVR